MKSIFDDVSKLENKIPIKSKLMSYLLKLNSTHSFKNNELKSKKRPNIDVN